MDDAEAETTKAADRPMELKIGMWPPHRVNVKSVLSVLSNLCPSDKTISVGGKHQQK